MKVKKLIFTMLIFGLIFSSLNLNSVGAKEKKTYKNDKVIYTVIEESENYSKVKVKELKTGKIEYLETILENGKFVNYVYSEDNVKLHKIESINDTVYIDGLQLGGETSKVVESSESLNAPSKNHQNSPLLADTPGIASITWKYLSTSRGNSSWNMLMRHSSPV
jgi:hypothetical protein